MIATEEDKELVASLRRAMGDDGFSIFRFNHAVMLSLLKKVDDSISTIDLKRILLKANDAIDRVYITIYTGEL